MCSGMIKKIWLAALLALMPLLSFALTYDLPKSGDVVGETKVIHAEHEDTFVKLARKHDVGYYELVDANPGVDPWLPGEGTRIVIPTQFILPAGPRDGIVINLAELRLYYFDKANNKVSTFPVGIGSEYWPTPTMANEKIVAKEKDPSWRVPPSIMREHENAGQPIPAVWGPGPNNPLGAYAFRTSHPGILIHGTDTPVGIGRRVTHGCVRMYPEDVEKLYYEVPVGTSLQIINAPVKAGWDDGTLYIELHKPLSGYPIQADIHPTIMDAINSKAAPSAAMVDWELVEQLSKHHPGIPEKIGEMK